MAGFIGSPKMNFIGGATAAKHKADQIGVRPEHFELAAGAGSWPGKVILAEHLGSDSFLHVDVGDLGRLVVRTEGEHAAKPGVKISLKPMKDRIHRFDASGKTIRG